MTRQKIEWLAAARQHGSTAYCYPDLVDDSPEHFQKAFEAGIEPVAAYDELAERLDLIPLRDWTLERAQAFMGRVW